VRNRIINLILAMVAILTFLCRFTRQTAEPSAAAKAQAPSRHAGLVRSLAAAFATGRSCRCALLL